MAGVLLKKCIYLVIFLVLECTGDASTCVQESSRCLCKFNNDVVIDIPPFGSECDATQGNFTYLFFGCKDANVADAKYANVTKNDCKSTSVCLYNATSNELVNLGNKNQMKFNRSQEDPDAYQLVYNANTKIMLVCSPELSKPIFLISPKNETNKHNLMFISPVACKHTQKHTHGLSTGSTLLILFLVGACIYFVGGAIVLHFLRGARGTEMIPNIDFWKDLPNLVKDGLIFLLNGCRPTAVATAESYDRI